MRNGLDPAHKMVRSSNESAACLLPAAGLGAAHPGLPLDGDLL